MVNSYPILILFCLAGLTIRTCYEILKKAGSVDPQNKWIFAAVFFGMCLMLISWPFLSYLDPFQVNISDYIPWVGLIVILTGVGLAVGGLFQLRGLENINHLVMDGLYAKLRHPMYTGFILWIMGWIIFNRAAASLAIGLVCILNILYWRRIEEKKLVAEFGDKYREYKKSTWF
jgi:protein-S-isoprenylcysteine O-methyltransferase Ste14